ncbi:MAG: Crp/Fnr family transcriptional regulator, partial [Alphaproteobacteria bacterium]|nr:Crp/Fnr family transcriptional regulator [Alphaproteobacteria bacterium]
GLGSDVEGHLDVIRALPLFRDFNATVLRELLRSARLVHHDKGSIFLTQGEPAGRFSIILDGWVKIYKSTAEGEESILQILGRREHVLGTDILQPGPSPVSAKAISKVKLLTFPSGVMREYVAQNKELALNMLAASARRAQRLINHFEQRTLRSAQHRVGSFLLNLTLETGIGGPPLVLPFEKSLIAAYLGIKPETFSRILKNFRAEGFRIERNQIVLPEPYALCDYCEADTAFKCDLAGSPACPQAEARKVRENKAG